MNESALCGGTYALDSTAHYMQRICWLNSLHPVSGGVMYVSPNAAASPSTADTCTRAPGGMPPQPDPPGNRSLSVDSRSPAPAGSPLYFCPGSSEDSRHVFPSRPGLCSKQRSRRSTTHSPRSSPKDRDGVSAAELCSRRSGRIGKAPMSTSSCRRTAASRLWTPRWNPRFTNGMSALGASRIEVQDRSLKFSFPMGRIEITQLDPTPNLPPELAVVEGREIAAYSNGQILTGKLYGRGKRLPPRDLFDIAGARHEDPSALRTAVNFLDANLYTEIIHSIRMDAETYGTSEKSHRALFKAFRASRNQWVTIDSRVPIRVFQRLPVRMKPRTRSSSQHRGGPI